MILIASKGHFFTQRLQPIHNASLMMLHLSVFSTFIQIFPYAFIGHIFLHSRLHFEGLHFSGFKRANLFLLLVMVYKKYNFKD